MVARRGKDGAGAGQLHMSRRRAPMSTGAVGRNCDLLARLHSGDPTLGQQASMQERIARPIGEFNETKSLFGAEPFDDPANRGAPVRGAKVGTRDHLAQELGGALSRVVVPGWIEAADEVSASLSSLARREARRSFLGRR